MIERFCGTLKVISLQKLIVRCVFDEVGVALVEELCHCEVAFEFSYTGNTDQCISTFLIACTV